MNESLNFTPFPSNSIQGGYLIWEGANLSTVLLAGQEPDYWEVQYPSFGISLSCYRDKSETWLLEAGTTEVGLAPPLPLLTCKYRQGEELIQTYRYEYPQGYCNSQQLEFFNMHMSDVVACFEGIKKYILEPSQPAMGPPIRPGCIQIIKGTGGASEEISYHLLTADEVLYVNLALSFDDQEDVYTGPIFRGDGRLPIAILAIDFPGMTHTIKPYLGYEDSTDLLPCTRIAAEILKNKEFYRCEVAGQRGRLSGP